LLPWIQEYQSGKFNCLIILSSPGLLKTRTLTEIVGRADEGGYTSGEDTARINHAYTAKLEHIARVEAEGDWETYMVLHERAYRIDVFDRIKNRLPDKTYWEMLGWLYADQEFVHNQWTKLRKLLQSPRPHREYIMSEAYRATFAALPDELALYRGHNKGNGSGWSWTLSEEKGIWFAERFTDGKQTNGRQPRLFVGTAKKKDAIAYLGFRNEEEILIDPKLVSVVEKRTLKKDGHHE
jgi:hypothetical protein